MSDNERQERKQGCNQCGKVLSNKSKLKGHIRFVHNNEKLIKCQFCDHTDFRMDNMKVPNVSFYQILKENSVQITKQGTRWG